MGIILKECLLACPLYKGKRRPEYRIIILRKPKRNHVLLVLMCFYMGIKKVIKSDMNHFIFPFLTPDSLVLNVFRISRDIGINNVYHQD